MIARCKRGGGERRVAEHLAGGREDGLFELESVRPRS